MWRSCSWLFLEVSKLIVAAKCASKWYSTVKSLALELLDALMMAQGFSLTGSSCGVYHKNTQGLLRVIQTWKMMESKTEVSSNVPRWVTLHMMLEWCWICFKCFLSLFSFSMDLLRLWTSLNPFRKEIRAVEDRLSRQIQSDRKEEAGYNGANQLIPVLASTPICQSSMVSTPHLRLLLLYVVLYMFHFNQFWFLGMNGIKVEFTMYNVPISSWTTDLVLIYCKSPATLWMATGSASLI